MNAFRRLPIARAVHPAGALIRALIRALLTVVLLSPPLAHAQFYRWVDDQGNVHYTDSIPPEYAEKGHRVLSPDGVQVQEVPRAKTLEEIQRERELERLRAQQSRLIEQQKAADQVLLRTFRSEDDLIMVRDGKLQAVDVLIQVTKSNIRRQQDWINSLRAEAAELERAGKPVPTRISEGIAKTESALRDAMAAILERERQKQEIRDTFSRDLKRFRQLRDIPDSPVELVETTTAVLDNLVTCDSVASCDELWTRAREYLHAHATLPVESSGTDVVMTAPPQNLGDVALIVSRIWDKDGTGASIFLDVQCKSYTATLGECIGPEAKRVLEGFRAAMEGGSS